MTCTSESSTFNDFTTNFVGGAKGNIGTVPEMVTNTPGSISRRQRHGRKPAPAELPSPLLPIPPREAVR